MSWITRTSQSPHQPPCSLGRMECQVMLGLRGTSWSAQGNGPFSTWDGHTANASGSSVAAGSLKTGHCFFPFGHSTEGTPTKVQDKSPAKGEGARPATAELLGPRLGSLPPPMRFCVPRSSGPDKLPCEASQQRLPGCTPHFV